MYERCSWLSTRVVLPCFNLLRSTIVATRTSRITALRSQAYIYFPPPPLTHPLQHIIRLGDLTCDPLVYLLPVMVFRSPPTVLSQRTCTLLSYPPFPPNKRPPDSLNTRRIPYTYLVAHCRYSFSIPHDHYPHLTRSCFSPPRRWASGVVGRLMYWD